MERDLRISKLMRESGITPAPGNFTDQVMKKINLEHERRAYKPIIGRTGRILIILFILAIVAVSIIYSEPGGRIIDSTGVLPDIEWKVPEFNFNLNFLKEIQIPTGILSAILALLILVLSDAGLQRKRLV